MIRFGNKCIISLLNVLANTRNTKRKIVWVEFGKKIEFGISEPLSYGCSNQMGLKFYAEYGYFEYFKKTTALWFYIIKNRLKKSSKSADMV